LTKVQSTEILSNVEYVEIVADDLT